MKNLLAIVLALLLGTWTVSAYDGYDVNFDQQAGSYSLEFNLGETSISQLTIDGQIFSVINFEGSVNTKKTGFAELPFVHTAVMLEANNNVDLQFSGGAYEDIQLEYPLLPSRGVIYRDQDPSAVPYVIDPKSNTDDWYPGDLANSTEPYILRDVRGTNVYVYPFQYNAAKNILRVYKTVQVNLVNNNTIAINPLEEHSTIVYEMDAIYASVFINYTHNKDDLTIGEMGDILVICTDRDSTAINPYIQWKREKGYLVTKEVVAAGTNVNSMVQDAYNNNNNLLYVQLVGDWADIKCNTLNGGAPPMDPQIGCVAGSDEVPDITVGRFSAENTTHVTTQVDKVITFEKTPQMGADWYKTATGIGSQEGPGDDGELDKEHLDVIFNDKYDPFTFDIYNPIYEPSATINDIFAAVDGGTSAINYCGHGSPTSWGTTGFSNSNVTNLANGDMTPFIISVACNNGDFHTGTCFAEAWQRHVGGGSVMFLGASISQPWQPPMRGEDYFADILIGGYDYTAHAGQNGISTTEGRTTLGAMVFNGLVLMTTESGGSSDWETAKTWNLFGDPSMQARTAAPADLTLSNQGVMAGIPFITTITAAGSPVEGAMVTISQNDNYFTGITDASGSATITHTLAPGDALLVVTGFNTETIYDTITVIPADGAYIVYTGHTVNDAAGNNNGLLDYGETAMLSISLTNVGTEDAVNVDVLLSSDDDNVSITDGSENYGTVPSGDTITIADGFSLDVAAAIPDLHNILFNIEATADETWNSSFTDQGHAPVLSYGGFMISDAGGNGNGKLDPGETADLIITVNNEGSSDAAGVAALLSSSSQYIEIEEATMTYGPIVAGGSAEQTYIVTAGTDTPAGHSAEFMMDITANLGISGSGEFFLIVGQIPVLIIDLDGNQNSATEMMVSLGNLSVGAEMVNEWPDDLNMYSSVFVCLGIYMDNHVLSDAEGQDLVAYLNAGGKLYMEGGDTWFFDPATSVHPMFSINGLEDGDGDLGIIKGESGTFTEDLSYEYSGDNNWIDQIAPSGDAFLIFNNWVPLYGVGVANVGTNYKTIGCSFEFGGLDDDGGSTKDFLMHQYLDFFDIDNVWVSLPEANENRVIMGQVYPNPFTNETNISFNLKEKTDLSIEVYNVNGKLINSLVNAKLSAGKHIIKWNADADGVSEGVYFFRIISEDEVITRKVILMH
ncbi:MAG: C25 family cysteine peptidase [Bacteroidota bacterium]